MHEVEARQIEEENRHLLKARALLLETKEGHLLFGQEAGYQEMYETLADEEISAIASVDFPLFVLNIDPAELRDVVADDLNFTQRTNAETILYECNLLILTNRWQKSNQKSPPEILFHTKQQIYEALSKLSFTQLQSVARRNKLLSKIVVTTNAFERMVYFESLTRDERNCLIVTG